MDPYYFDIDGFWPRDADIKSPEVVPIANYKYGRRKIGGESGFNSNSSFEPASVPF
jgi:hypothetical protein